MLAAEQFKAFAVTGSQGFIKGCNCSFQRPKVCVCEIYNYFLPNEREWIVHKRQYRACLTRMEHFRVRYHAIHQNVSCHVIRVSG